MRIVIASPLYPPDIAEPAPYVKELSRRLSKKHTVTVVTYGHLPEDVPGVRIVAIDKRQSRPVRLFLYTIALLQAARSADVIYAQNGPSVELPLGVVLRLLSRPLFVRMGDEHARANAQSNKRLARIQTFGLANAKLVTDSPMAHPEILPLKPRPDSQLEAYEHSWASHLNILETTFQHGA